MRQSSGFCLERNMKNAALPRGCVFLLSNSAMRFPINSGTRTGSGGSWKAPIMQNRGNIHILREENRERGRNPQRDQYINPDVISRRKKDVHERAEGFFPKAPASAPLAKPYLSRVPALCCGGFRQENAAGADHGPGGAGDPGLAAKTFPGL